MLHPTNGRQWLRPFRLIGAAGAAAFLLLGPGPAQAEAGYGDPGRAGAGAAGSSSAGKGKGSMASSAGSSTTPNLGEAMNPSTPEQMELSDHLRRKGVLFYGAWWCPACFRQKNEFGKEAGNRLPYVECEKTEAERERCTAAGIRAFPTWVMGEQRVEGIQTIEQLKRWSSFPGSGNTR